MPVGAPTWKAEWGQKFFPGLLDRHLGRTTYQGQQTGGPDPHDRPGNLFEPVSGDPGTHGAFNDTATARSPALWVEENRGPILGTAALVGALAALGWYGARSRSASARTVRDRLAHASQRLRNR